MFGDNYNQMLKSGDSLSLSSLRHLLSKLRFVYIST